MENLNNILVHLFNNYPNSKELSFSRVMKLLFLIDWKYAITKFERLTNLNWTLNQFGPYNSSILDIMDNSNDFEIKRIVNEDNKNIVLINFLEKGEYDLKAETKHTIEFVINHCSKMSWSELNNLVNSTFPIIRGKINSELNLIELAKEYKNIKE
ncbi:MAG: SocA family protein [Flavobacterium sp.]|nr:SocA family protein [Flavobacterium sp.]